MSTKPKDKRKDQIMGTKTGRKRVNCPHCPREITDYMMNQHLRKAHPIAVNMPRKAAKKKPIKISAATAHLAPIDLFKPDIEQFTTGAVRRKTETIRLDLIPLEALEGYGRRLHYGATVRGYGPRNWEKGIDYANLIQHCQTHLSKLAMQIVSQREGTFAKQNPSIVDYQVDSEGQDTAYGNACALLWNAAAIVTLLARGNPAEKK